MGTIAGNPLTVSTTTQLMVPADTMRCYTLVNDGLYTVYGLGNPRAIPSMTTKTAAELLAISPAPFALNAGEAIELEHLSALYVAVASDGGGTSVVRIMPGRMSGAINATVNVGNVGLVNAAETEINPAVSVVEDAAHSSGEAVNPVAAVRTDTRASLAGTTGDWAPPQLNANGELRVRSDDNCKGRVVPQADDAANAGAATYEAAITIPASVLAVRMYLDAAMYVVVDNTTGNPTNTGAPVPADRLVDIPCVGCTKLHIAQVAGNVVVKYSYVYAS